MADLGSGRSAPSQSRLKWPVRRSAAGAEETAEDIAAQDIAELEAADRQLPQPPPEPVMMAEPPQRFNLAILRLAGLGLALVLALALTMVRLFVAGPSSVADLRAQAGVEGWTELTVGVKDDQPGVAYYEKKNGIWSGFDIDIAYMIAEDLGFRRAEVKFYAIESEDRARMQAVDAKGNRVPVKLVIASFSITPDREAMAGVTFSQPYLFTEQSVITLPAHARVSTFSDLKGRLACTLSTSTSESAAAKAGVKLISMNRVSDCFRELDLRHVEAVTTDAAILAGYMAKYPHKYAHWDIGLDATEAWGVNVGENKALKTLVDITLYRSLKDPADNRWELAYQDNLQSEVGANPGTPIAVATQPNVDRPNVRELPWESNLP